MAKFCPNCGKEIDANAALCLNCGVIIGNNNQNTTNDNGKKTKKKGLPTWAIVLIVVGCVVLLPILLVLVIGIFTFNTIKDTDVNFENYIDGTVTTQSGTIGDTLTGDDFKITLTSALMYDSIGDDEYYVDTPAEGKEYLVFFFDVENITNESQYISSYDFYGYVDGYAISNEFLFNDIDGVEELSATLTPGTRTKGYIAFEVDKTWQEFEICFDDWDWFNDAELKFNVVNENSSISTGA